MSPDSKNGTHFLLLLFLLMVVNKNTGSKTMCSITQSTPSGIAEGGGVCVYVNEKLCHSNIAVIKRHWCSPRLECLTVSLRPYYLPHEFSHIIYNTIYVPNHNLAKPAAQELCEIIDNIETSSPDALVLINGDFNYCSLKKPASNITKTCLCYARERDP